VVRVFFTLVCLAFIRCSSGDKGKDISIKSDLPTQELWDARVNFSEGAQRRAVLEAKYIAKYEEQLLTRAKGLRVTFLDSAGLADGVLLADSGVIHDNTNLIEVFGQVKFYSMEGETLWTDYLFWDPKDELVKTKSYVKLVRNGEYLEGNGMETDIHFENVKFIGNVRGRTKGKL